MYPLYWTPSRGGIIMRYTYEYKRKCVELYREGKWPETPEGVSDKSFRDKVRLGRVKIFSHFSLQALA